MPPSPKGEGILAQFWMKRVNVVMMCLLAVGCANGTDPSGDTSVSCGEDAGEAGNTTLSMSDASLADGFVPAKSCGIYTSAEGTTYDFGGCPNGFQCGDNNQPNLCGNACLPQNNPSICNDWLLTYGYASGSLAQYSTNCVTDPPIDESNCILYSKSSWDHPYGCPDCNINVWCCLPPYVGQGDAGMGGD